MTYYLIFFITVIISIFFFVFKNKTLSFKLLLSIGFTVFVLAISLFMFTKLWNSSDHQREELILDMENLQNNYKKIIIRNKTNQRLNLEVDFEYSSEEIKTQELNILDYYNVKNILVIEPNKQHIVMLPINKKQQVNFPNNFKIIVKDSSFNSIEKYDRELFFKKCTSQPKIVNHKTDAVLWRLDIK